MKNIALLTFLVFSNIAFASDIPSKIFSMNLHCTIERWEFRLDTILDKIVELDPDIISFQEVCKSKSEDMILFIRSGLLNRGYNFKVMEKYFTHRAWGKYDEYLLMISKGIATEVQKGLLPPSPLMRSYIGMKVGKTWFINTHLEHKSDYESFRQKQLSYLINKFKNTPHIIMGDFNSSPTDTEQRELHRMNYLSYFPPVSYPLPAPVKAIDGFWVSSLLRLKNAKLSTFFKESHQGIYLSDHMAVFLRVQ